jgi:hypothetical protein
MDLTQIILSFMSIGIFVSLLLDASRSNEPILIAYAFLTLGATLFMIYFIGKKETDDEVRDIKNKDLEGKKIG